MSEGANIPIRNIFHMLAYAFRTLSQGEYAKLDAENFDHVHDLLAAVLSLGLARQLKQGLRRQYVTNSDELDTLRGKLDVVGTARMRLARRQALCCAFDDLTEDNAANRAIKSTCRLLGRHGKVTANRRRDLLHEVAYLSHVRDVDLRRVRWDALRQERLSASYRTLVSICRMVAEGMLLSQETGEYRLAEYLDDQRLHRLFEKFVLNYYRIEHPYLKAGAPQIPWALDDGTSVLLPSMRTDITLSRGNHILIIDTKFYAHTLATHHGSLSIHSQNLYQVFTYVKNRDALFADVPHEVSGMLLYARTTHRTQPDMSYLMSGNRIEVRTLDLSADFAHISASLDSIAHEHFKEEHRALAGS